VVRPSLYLSIKGTAITIGTTRNHLPTSQEVTVIKLKKLQESVNNLQITQNLLNITFIAEMNTRGRKVDYSHQQAAAPRVVSGGLSGSCLCRAFEWTLPKETPFGQVLVCHCESCRKISGATNVPFVALPRKDLWKQLYKATTVRAYQASEYAKRHFCQNCGSFVCMDYHHEPSTLWVPLGTLQDFDPSVLDPTKDGHIVKEEEVEYGKELGKLEHFYGFGLYKRNVCCGKSWDELEGWQD
jgi:hypothetical protein